MPKRCARCRRPATHGVLDEVLAGFHYTHEDGFHWEWKPQAVWHCNRHARPGVRQDLARMADAVASVCARAAGITDAAEFFRLLDVLRAGLGDLPRVSPGG